MASMKKITFLILILSFNSEAASINCFSKHSLYHDKLKIVAFYHFILNKNKGAVLINGKLSYEDTDFTISRSIYFSYEKNGAETYIAKSDKQSKIPADNAPDYIMKQHYPSFFIYPKKTLIFRVERVNTKSSIISFVNTPIFYCSEK